MFDSVTFVSWSLVNDQRSVYKWISPFMSKFREIIEVLSEKPFAKSTIFRRKNQSNSLFVILFKLNFDIYNDFIFFSICCTRRLIVLRHLYEVGDIVFIRVNQGSYFKALKLSLNFFKQRNRVEFAVKNV